MNKERKNSARILTRENKRIIMKIEHYLESRYINQVAGKEIMSDIVGMAIECQERGDSFSEMIGSDHEAFCRELIRNSPRQHMHERILHVLHWFILFATCLMPSLYLFEALMPKYFPGCVDGLIFTVKLSYILKYYIIMLVLVIGWFIVRMHTYKPTKYVFGTYFAVFMLFFIFTDGVLAFIMNDTLLHINILIWTLAVAALLVICDLTRLVIAMSIAYKKRKSDN